MELTKKRYSILIVFALIITIACSSSVDTNESEDAQTAPSYVLLVHGGAGVFNPDQLPYGREEEYLKAVNKALDIGENILANGGTALDAVEKVIVFLEDQPILNAGKGAVFTAEGTNELDASIMDGSNLNAGAIGSVTNIKNPIIAARFIMERSPHVFLVGAGAEQFAASMGCEVVDPSYFFTEERFEALQRIQELDRVREEENRGTVGAVALDQHGNLAAGTSTGGMTNKRFGRIGDSPIIGAGTYADNKGCAVSSTGHGEYFIRFAVAYDLNAKVRYKQLGIEEAARIIIHEELPEAGGLGGLIAVDTTGKYTMPFNTDGMIRGVVTPEYRKAKVY